jgi:hypothetical protein
MNVTSRIPLFSQESPALQLTYLEKLGLCLLALVVAGHVLVIGHSSYLSLMDWPNHVARATIMADLMFQRGAHFGAEFQYHFMAIPYVLGDIVLATLVALSGPEAAASCWECIAFISLPCALVFYLGVARAPPLGQLVGALCATYLSLDLFFVWGFLEFRLALALSIVALALATLLRRSPSLTVTAVYFVVVLVGYFVHLAAVVFVATAVGATGVLRLWLGRTTFRNEALLWSPILLALGWHFGVMHDAQALDPSDMPHWGTLSEKLDRAFAAFRRFDGDKYLKRAFLVCLCLCGFQAMAGARRFRAWLSNPAVGDCLILAIAFITLYFVLPRSTDEADFIDVRAISEAAIFLMVAFLVVPPTAATQDTRFKTFVLLSAAAVAFANLILVGLYFERQSGWIAGYRELVGSIPVGARVLTISPRMGAPYSYAGSEAVIDRGALDPYLFGGDLGYPQRHFRYVHRPYAPRKAWVQHHDFSSVDWGRIACAYQFLVTVKPFGQYRVGVETTTILENSSGALLRVDPRSCSRHDALE